MSASTLFKMQFKSRCDRLAIDIVEVIQPPPHAGGVLLLSAMTIMGHLAGHLENVRAMEGKPRLGYDAAMLEAFSLLQAGMPKAN